MAQVQKRIAERMSDEQLTELWQRVGRKHGFTDVQAEFVDFRDFKVKWTRNYKWAEFQVSDYLADAPAEVLEGLSDTIFHKIRGDESDYPENVKGWLTAPEFSKTHQATYIGRLVGFKQERGHSKDLADSVARLKALGLIDETDFQMGWRDLGRSAGRASVLMKVVVVSSFLDEEGVDDSALDLALWAQVARVKLGFNPGAQDTEERYQDMLCRFPDRVGAERKLSSLGLHL